MVERIAFFHRLGLGYRAIASQLNGEGIATAHGGRKWYPVTVRAVLRSRGHVPATPSTRGDASRKLGAIRARLRRRPW